MKKQVVALILAMLMVLALLTGCAPKQTQETQKTQETPKTDQKQDAPSTDKKDQQTNTEASEEIPVDKFKGTKLKGVIVKYDRDESNGPDDKEILKMAEEATGIDIEWTVVENAVYKEQRNIILASGELPDFMLGMMDNDTLTQNAELFYDLSKDNLLETYAPNVLRDYEEGQQGVLSQLTMADGSIRCLAGNIGTEFNSNIFNVMWINKAWLDKLNMEVPTTTDELYNVLCAFRDNDMNGNGDTKDEIPMAFCAANNYRIINLANCFGITGTGYGDDTYYFELHDGVVEATADTNEYRAYLEYCHKLADEGLLNLEGYSNTYEQYTSMLAEGKIGVWFGWSPKTDSCGNPEEFVPMMPPQGIEGVEVRKTGYLDKPVFRTAALAISAKTENVEAILHWWNWFSKDVETKYLCRWGNFYYDENGQIRNGVPADKLPEGVAASTLEYTYGMGNQTSPYIGPQDYMQKFNENDLRHQFYNEVKDTIPAGEGDELLSSKAIIDPEKVSERTFIEADLLPMMSNFEATSIAEGVTDETWNAYLKNLKDYGYYDWLAWWQSFANGEF